MDKHEDGTAFDREEQMYNVNLFQIKPMQQSKKPTLQSNIQQKKDFKVQVLVNNHLEYIIADTGARVKVCGTTQANKWDLIGHIVPKFRLYNSADTKVQGIAKCAITFGQNSVPVEWHILSGSCEPILSGERAQQLGFIQSNAKPNMYQPIMMINKHLEDHMKSDIQSILKDFPENFSGLGKLKH